MDYFDTISGDKNHELSTSYLTGRYPIGNITMMWFPLIFIS